MKDFKLFGQAWSFKEINQRKTILDTIVYSLQSINYVSINDWFPNEKDVKKSLKKYLKKMPKSILKNLYNKLKEKRNERQAL